MHIAKSKGSKSFSRYCANYLSWENLIATGVHRHEKQTTNR